MGPIWAVLSGRSRPSPGLPSHIFGSLFPLLFLFLVVSARQAKGTKGNNRNGAVVEFFGLHEFALLKPDALRPLSTLDKSPNKTVRASLLLFPGLRTCTQIVDLLIDARHQLLLSL